MGNESIFHSWAAAYVTNRRRDTLLCNAIVSAAILWAVLLLFIDILLFLWYIVLIFYYA